MKSRLYLQENITSFHQEAITFAFSFIASLAYLLVGAFTISMGKNRDFLQAFYFMYTTLASIGFGGESFENEINMYVFIPYFCAGYTLLVMVATSGKAITRRIIIFVVKAFGTYQENRERRKKNRLVLFRAKDGRYDLAKKREKYKDMKLAKRREKHRDYIAKNRAIS